jgi:hypothetical protein
MPNVLLQKASGKAQQIDICKQSNVIVLSDTHAGIEEL